MKYCETKLIMKVLSLYKYNIEFFQPLISKEINGQIKASIYLALLCFKS